MATPLISPLRVQGGTFYSFSSAVNDIQKTFTDDDARFVFSKFALLNIPDVDTPSSANRQNFVVWEGIGSVATGGTSSVPNSSYSTDQNVNLAQSFQNYALNFEELILKGNNTLGRAYNTSELYTTSERIFWKWLTQINAIRFRSANSSEANTNSRFTELNEASNYKRVVKYIGDIDIVNNVSRGGHAYSEVYINVPTQHGSTPTVLWKTYSDTNYGPGRQWTLASEFISGRDAASIHPNGLELRAFYDNDANNRYETKSQFGLTGSDSIFATANGGGSSKPVRLSRMDGCILDLDPFSYTDIVNDSAISSIGEYNSVDKAQDFSFNAALVYYDVYSASNPEEKATNLYGILILDDYVNSVSNASFLKRYDKFKPNSVTKLNGNGYSLKLNLRFDTSISNSGVETIINEYNTFSMDLFIDASTRMQEAAEMFMDTELDIIEIKDRLIKLENFLFSQDDLDIIAKRISNLEQNLVNAKLAYNSSSTLLDLINNNASNINQIINGNLPVNLTFNTDVILPGDGINLDKSINNRLKIVNKNQGYSNFAICKNVSSLNNPKRTLLTVANNGINLNDTEKNNILVLGQFSNYFRQLNEGHTNFDLNLNTEIFNDDLLINIDDSNSEWKKGQLFRIVFQDNIDINGKSISIYSDAKNKLGQGSFGKNIGTIIPSDLISTKPIIDIVCTDEILYTFNIDIIR